MRSQVLRLHEEAVAPAPGDDPVAAVAELLIRIGRDMLEHPQLSLSMIQANNLAQKVPGSASDQIDEVFEEQDPRGTPFAVLDGRPVGFDTLSDPESLGALIRS